MKRTVRTLFAVIATSFWTATIWTGALSGYQAGAGASQQVPAKSPAAVKGSKDASKDGKALAPKADAAQDSDEPYVIGISDLLEITVWDNAKLSGFRDVGPDGMISMPLIGQLKADGLTIRQLTDLVKSKLTTLMEDPEVNVQVAKINSKKYFLMGACLRNGEFPLVGKMTILDAFANCGGFREFARLNKTYIVRENGERVNFNYKDLSQGKHLEQNIRLRNMDRIYVPE